MEVVILPDAAAVAGLAADAVEALLTRRPDAVLGLATGSSPLGVYDELAVRCAAGRVSFSQATAFLLDEYVGLPSSHPQSYRQVIARELAQWVDIRSAAVHGPDGSASDLPAACRRYEQAIADAGGVDLQLLGIGSDGHVAFNEPSSSLASRTRLKTLTEQTRQDNARFFGTREEVPHHVLTQGLGTVSEARHVVLLATGAGKAPAVRAMVEGPVSAMCPASVLQLHPHASVLLDEDAARDLALADYFRETWAAKPDWQGL
ncbi:MAG TPA: glucosamine-6-phosphate deaminase [Actinomycetales bacterium]|nr:glucosamine-6-phosphate deaminase [Actinomycetales bacterium]